MLQAKIEPGNINFVQLAPTLQATRSNYTQAHKGKTPLYLEYFENARPHQILLDQLQSEQGGRFLKKRNRNIIIKLEEDIPVYDNFEWVTLAELKKLMRYDNLVGMDTRTVISGIPFGTFDDEVVDFFVFLGCDKVHDPVNKAFLRSALSRNGALHSIEEIITFLTHLKSIYDLEITRVPLRNVRDWVFGESEIFHKDSKFFKIIGVEVEIGNREVQQWNQPLKQPAQEGLCAFVCKEINGCFILQSRQSWNVEISTSLSLHPLFNV